MFAGWSGSPECELQTGLIPYIWLQVDLQYMDTMSVIYMDTMSVSSQQDTFQQPEAGLEMGCLSNSEDPHNKKVTLLKFS